MLKKCMLNKWGPLGLLALLGAFYSLVCDANTHDPLSAPTFDTLRLHYVSQKPVSTGSTNEGVSLSGSIQLSKQAFAGASFAQVSIENGAGESNQQSYVYLGLFNDVPRMLNTRVALQVGYRQATLKQSNNQALSEGAGSVAVSLRNRSYDRIELRADFEYIDWSETQSGFAGEFALGYFIAGSLALEAAFRKQGDIENLSGGMAYYF